MIAVDTNILVYAHRSDDRFHDKALKAVCDLGESGARWAIPWPCAHEFLSVVTNPRIFEVPTLREIALAALRDWSTSPNFSFLAETDGHLERLSAVVLSSRVEGAMIHDAKVAAICLDHSVRELWTLDRDFTRFPQLKTRNPLV